MNVPLKSFSGSGDSTTDQLIRLISLNKLLLKAEESGTLNFGYFCTLLDDIALCIRDSGLSNREFNSEVRKKRKFAEFPNGHLVLTKEGTIHG